MDQENFQQEFGFELSEDNVHVLGEVVDIGLSGLRGEAVVSDIDDSDSDYEIDASIRVDMESADEDETSHVLSSTPDNFRSCRNLKKKLPNFVEVRDSDRNNPSFKLGMVFNSSKVFKDDIRE